MPLDRAVLAELRRRQQNGLYAVGVELTNRAKVLATRHTDNGTRRNSITQTKSQDGRSVLWGIPEKSAPHAVHLELGFKPHWVPSKYIGVWMQRHGAGILRNGQAVRGKVTPGKARARINLKARGTSVSMGLYVGGPGSNLQSAQGGATGRLYRGRRFVTRHWHTKGGTSKFLTQGKVGHPILQPTAEQITSIPLEVYKRGFLAGGSRGR